MLFCGALFSPLGSLARTVTINTPMGPVKIDVSHLGPQGDLVTPEAPEAAAFHPPQIFSVPLPSGSGARALGSGGAFTALADDATAAFSNPAGLAHFVKMEVSLEARQSDFTHEFTDRGHAFEDPTGIGIDTVSGLQTGRNSTQVTDVSFLSFVYPRRRWAILRTWPTSALSYGRSKKPLSPVSRILSSCL